MFKQKGLSAGDCSFCGKQQSQQRRLVAGPGVVICNECVSLCTEILEQEGAATVVQLEPHSVEAMVNLPDEVLPEGLRQRAFGMHAAQGQMQAAVTILRRRGITWAKIAEALGVSRQSAWERYPSSRKNVHCVAQPKAIHIQILSTLWNES